MRTRKLAGMMAFVILLISGAVMNAQVNQSGKDKESQGMGKGMGMGSGSMQECMNQIASDSTMRNEMFTKLMDNMKGDTTAMKHMCRQMMNDPDMHEVMMKMMYQEGSGGMGGRMMKGGTMKHDIDDEMGDTSTMHNTKMP
ncbi:MAG TPA: hypothetical protein VK207_11975 [Bacteroidales bacterium]|nr:hypothetical protein [Bacteroidales bacterium]